MFKKIINSLTLFSLTLLMSGCSYDFVVSPNETAYLYQKDIYDSVRYNPGSDYVMSYPFETKKQMLYIDYGTTTTIFDIDYTLTDKENKTRVKSKAIITFKLLRNPNDKKDLEFKDDEYAKFYTENIKALPKNNNSFKIDPNDVFNRLMNETLDKEFRKEFTNQDIYPDFDSIEANIEKIRDRIKKNLVVSAKKARIEIIGLSISSPEVPLPIQDSRDRMLELQQDALNNLKELEIKEDMAAGRMAVEVREAFNEAIIDKIAGNTNKGYLLIKTLNRAIDQKAPLNLTITPDLMRYLDNDNSKGVKMSDETVEALKNLNSEELKEHFSLNK